MVGVGVISGGLIRRVKLLTWSHPGRGILFLIALLLFFALFPGCLRSDIFDQESQA
jgi:hypothetical protein